MQSLEAAAARAGATAPAREVAAVAPVSVRTPGHCGGGPAALHAWQPWALAARLLTRHTNCCTVAQ